MPKTKKECNATILGFSNTINSGFGFWNISPNVFDKNVLQTLMFFACSLFDMCCFYRVMFIILAYIPS